MDDHHSCVARVPIFRGLRPEEQREVAGFARPVRVSKGDVVYGEGEAVSRLLVVHHGRLKISHLAPTGQEQIVRTAGEGDVVGERAFISGERPDHYAVALEDSQMCVFDHRDLAELLRTYPEIGSRMLRTLSDRLMSAERLLAAVTSSDVSARVAAYLLDLPAAVQEGELMVRLPMAKKDVASYLGTTPETLSRRLAALSDDGVIALSGRRDVRIVDPGALEQRAVPE